MNNKSNREAKMELTKEQKGYLLSRECGTPYQKKIIAILFTAISALKNDDKPTGVANDTDYLTEIERVLKTYHG